MTLLRQLFEAARQAGLRALGQRILWFAVLAGCLLSLIGPAIPETSTRRLTGTDFYGGVALALLQLGLPLVAVYLGLWSVHSDISDRSATHVFVRPISRVTLLLGRFAAVSLVAALATALVLGVIWVSFATTIRDWRHGLGLEAGLLGDFVLAAWLGAPAYVAFGMFCGANFRRPLVVGVLYVVGWEEFVGFLPPQSGVRLWTVIDPLRRFLLARTEAPVDDGLGEVLLNSAQGVDLATLPDPVFSIGCFTAVALGAALATAARREYDSRPRE